MMGLPVTSILLWWYWPEAHGYILHPLSIFLVGTATACDIVYPFLLHHVKLTEVILPDGTVIAGGDNAVGWVEGKKRQ